MPIYIGLGANLDHPRYGSPQRTLAAALDALAGVGVRPVRHSRWYRSSPMPPSGQPWYVNAVAQVLTGLGPDATLAALHRVEDAFGRVRRQRDEARVIDLDLLDYDSIVKENNLNGLARLPHPRLEMRAFVLLPLEELASGWRHPVSRASIATLIARLPADQQIAPLSD